MQITSVSSDVDAARAWRAVLERDRAFDDRVVYAVRTTGVFCRPSCGSRRPRRENVEFFEGTAAARDAGYRPCLRCRPESAGRTTPASTAREYLDAHATERVTLETLARVVGVSAAHLQREFTRAFGMSPKRYHDSLRQDEFRRALTSGATVSRATYEAGFGSSSRVYERSDAMLGMTPAAYKRGGAGVDISYAVVTTTYGETLVAVTERGVCAVLLGASTAALERDLRARFPRAAFREADAGARRVVRDVVASIEGSIDAASIPLDVAGSDFQRRVWDALRKIPRGATRSYSDIARAIGRPTATRAVARACASNSVAVLIPCHRVVREDGGLGGYRWGLDRKRRLLGDERVDTGPQGRLGED
jgi:AraC family transcriptional regulator of adaptative response/methylated-DNA-[protein]-cysteine methyltransferase